MTIPFWCLLVGALMPLGVAFAAYPHKTQQFGTVDQNEPRAQSAKLTGAGGRAVAAQANAWEALAMFTPAVLVANIAGADPGWSSTVAGIWVVARILHPIFYIQDNAPMRSLSFGAGFICCLALFGLAATA
ncbi:MAG: hypothetical protein GY725_16630 [bacterium]|nr:hypothetical protein [bacterium]